MLEFLLKSKMVSVFIVVINRIVANRYLMLGVY
jgi:hypothetical protein